MADDNWNERRPLYLRTGSGSEEESARIGKSPIRAKVLRNFNDLRGLVSPSEPTNIRTNRENSVVVHHLPLVSISKHNEAKSHDYSSFKSQDMSVR